MSDIPIIGEPKVMERESAPLLVLFALPTHDIVPAKFAISFAEMTFATGATLFADGVIDTHFAYYAGTYIAKSRMYLAARAVEVGATHIMWLDTDMTFPKDTLIQLLNRNVPIVGANYSKRRIPADFVAIKEIDMDGEAGQKCPTYPDSTGLEEVDAIGFGCLLMQTRVLLDMEPPFFEQYWDKEQKRYMGEDVYFCIKAREAGHRVFVDHDLSHDVGHMGMMRFWNLHADDSWQREGIGRYGDHDIQRASDSGIELVEPE